MISWDYGPYVVHVLDGQISALHCPRKWTEESSWRDRSADRVCRSPRIIPQISRDKETWIAVTIYLKRKHKYIYIYFLSLHLKQFGSSRITNNHMWNLKNKKKIYLIILINFKRKFILSLDSWKLYRIYWKKVFIILYAWCFIKGCVYVESMERKKVSNLWFFFMLVILKIRSSDKLIIFRLSHFLNWTSDLIRCHSFSIISD